MWRAAFAIPRILVGTILLAAIGVMLAGVFLRYVMLPITNTLGLPAVNFFWVEEIGELLLVWLALVGAAVGVAERSHFTLTILVHKFPVRIQRAIHVVNTLVIAVFGGILAWQGWNLAALNIGLGSPSLGISLGWLYGSLVAGGVLIVLYALGAAASSSDTSSRAE